MVTQDQLKAIITKAQKNNIAVFKIDNKIKTSIYPSKQFDNMMIDYGYLNALCGVYSSTATISMILEDIA